MLNRVVVILFLGILTGCIGAGANSTMKPGAEGLFPTVTGINLEGEEKTIPKDLEGNLRVVCVAFERQQQEDVNTWIDRLTTEVLKEHGLSFHELPVIYEASQAFRLWVNNGMRAGIRDEVARKRTITVYTDRTAFTSALELQLSSITTMLLDKDGTILWRADGRATDAAFNQLLETARAIQS
jgi:predicted transcriptional regulator